MQLKNALRALPLLVITFMAFIGATAVPAFASPAPSTVPEPLSITLLGVGVAGLAGKKWMDARRKK